MNINNFISLLLLIVLFILSVTLPLYKSLVISGKWKYMIPAILIPSVLFILWDIRFLQAGIWQFNPVFFLPYRLSSLPVELWLINIILPFFSLSVYEMLKIRLLKIEIPNVFVAISLGLILAFAIITYISYNQIYTFIVFLFTTAFLGYTVFRNRFKPYYTKFYLAYFILFVFLIIIYGILANLPVIEYNQTYMSGVVLIHIPVEVFISYFLMLMMNVTLYEFFLRKKFI